MKWIKLSEEKPKKHGAYAIKTFYPGSKSKGLFKGCEPATVVRWAVYESRKGPLLKVSDNEYVYSKITAFFSIFIDERDPIENVIEWMNLPNE